MWFTQFPPRRSLGAALLACAAMALPSMALAQSRTLTVEQATMADLKAPPSDLRVTAWVDRETTKTYYVGETVQLFVKADQDSYVWVLNHGTNDEIHQLFPNKYQRDNRVLAHQPVQVPGPDAGWRIKVGGPPGQDVIKVFVTRDPVAPYDQAKLAEMGPVYKYRGTSRSLAIEEVERRRTPWSEHTMLIRVLERRGAFTAPAPATTQTAAFPPMPELASAEELFQKAEARFFGEGARPDHRAALALYKKAAEAGHVGAMYRIGRLHEEGGDIDLSPVHAVDWYRRAADLGHAPAMVRLALIATQGGRDRAKLDEAVQWLKKAASLGDGNAMVNLAKLYDEGNGVRRNPKESARYVLSGLKAAAFVLISEVPKLSEETRRAIQSELKTAGYYKGPLDGQIGKETRAALVEWARAG